MDSMADSQGGWLINFELSTLVVLGLIGVVVHAMSRLWWEGHGAKPTVRYREGSRLCDQVVKSCPTLQERLEKGILVVYLDGDHNRGGWTWFIDYSTTCSLYRNAPFS